MSMQMQSLMSAMNASMSLARMQATGSASERAQGRANVLRAEIKQDRGSALKGKAEEAESLEKRAQNLTGDLMQGLNEVNEALKPEEEKPNETPKPEEEEPRLDKVELSARPQQETPAVIREEQPAVYDAGGSRVPPAAAPGAVLEARA